MLSETATWVFQAVSAFNTIDKIRLRQKSIYLFDLIMHLTYLRKPQLTDIGWLKRAFQAFMSMIRRRTVDDIFPRRLERIFRVNSPSQTFSHTSVWRDCLRLAHHPSLDLPVLRNASLSLEAKSSEVLHLANTESSTTTVYSLVPNRASPHKPLPAVLIPNLYQFGDCNQATFLNRVQVLRFLVIAIFMCFTFLVFVRRRAVSISSLSPH